MAITLVDGRWRYDAALGVGGTEKIRIPRGVGPVTIHAHPEGGASVDVDIITDTVDAYSADTYDFINWAEGAVTVPKSVVLEGEVTGLLLKTSGGTGAKFHIIGK